MLSGLGLVTSLDNDDENGKETLEEIKKGTPKKYADLAPV